jgi:hypothetical protein
MLHLLATNSRGVHLVALEIRGATTSVDIVK